MPDFSRRQAIKIKRGIAIRTILDIMPNTFVATNGSVLVTKYVPYPPKRQKKMNLLPLEHYHILSQQPAVG